VGAFTTAEAKAEYALVLASPMFSLVALSGRWRQWRSFSSRWRAIPFRRL